MLWILLYLLIGWFWTIWGWEDDGSQSFSEILWEFAIGSLLWPMTLGHAVYLTFLKGDTNDGPN